MFQLFNITSYPKENYYIFIQNKKYNNIYIIYNTYQDTLTMPIKTPCAGRKRTKCMRAKKSCKYASGKLRKFCRKSRNTRRARK